LINHRSTVFYRDWDRIAHDAVGSLRAEAARHPDDKTMTRLIGELATRSDQFRVRWGGHDVRY
jgi:MmyB-like transcription regulator ligand binding domain